MRRKQSSASAGLCTIGSFSLNEVFRTIGTPVRCSNARIKSPVPRVALATDGLHPARSVHVRHRWDDAPLIGPDRIHLYHERVGHRPREVVLMRLLQHGGRERPELLAKFDLAC